MDNDLKNRWIEALESGRYKQGKGVLCKDGFHCCLGVLMDIEPSVKRSGTLETLETSACGIKMKELLELSWMNDGTERQRRSFKEIAHWIRKHL